MDYQTRQALETVAAMPACADNAAAIEMARRALDDAAAREKADEEKTAGARQQAAAQMSGIAEMVAALECDYARLEELRDERESLQDAVFDALEAVDEADAEQSAARRDNEAFNAAALDDACENLESAEADLYEFGADEGAELAELEAAAGDCADEEEARQRIQEDPLSIEVRSGWTAPGDGMEAEEFIILLCTGGPAARIVGELDQYKQPARAWLEYQDWFTPWIEYHGENADGAALLTYCQQFYFGD